MHHVGLDLLELLRRQAAAGDGEHPGLVRRDDRLALAQMVHEARESEMLDPGGGVLGHHGRFVGGHHGREVLVQLLQDQPQLGVGRGHLLQHALPALPQQEVELAAAVAELDAALDELHPLRDHLEVPRVELLGLHQHLFADAHLAEVVEQRGVADRLHLVGREADLAEGAGVGAVRRRGQRHRQVRHPEGMA